MSCIKDIDGCLQSRLKIGWAYTALNSHTYAEMQRKPHGSASERRSGRRFSSFTACKCLLNKANISPRMTASRATHIIVLSTSSVVTDLKKKGPRRAWSDTELICACLLSVIADILPGRRKKVKSQRFVSQSVSAFPDVLPAFMSAFVRRALFQPNGTQWRLGIKPVAELSNH